MPWPLHIVTVAGLVEDGKGNVLLTKSALRKEWEPCGGLVEPGENLEEALLREIREESGVKATVRCLTGIYSSVKAMIWHDGTTPVPPKLHLDFLCDYAGGELCTSDETTEVIWCPRENVLERIANPVTRIRVQNQLEFSGRIHYQAYSSKPFEEHLHRLV